MADSIQTTRFRFWLWLIRAVGVIVPRRLCANWRQECQVFIGMAIGLAGAFAMTRALSSILLDVGATDPATFIGVMILLGAVALLACWLPARRAAKVDPLLALRHD